MLVFYIGPWYRVKQLYSSRSVILSNDHLLPIVDFKIYTLALKNQNFNRSKTRQEISNLKKYDHLKNIWNKITKQSKQLQNSFWAHWLFKYYAKTNSRTGIFRDMKLPSYILRLLVLDKLTRVILQNICNKITKQSWQLQDSFWAHWLFKYYAITNSRTESCRDMKLPSYILRLLDLDKLTRSRSYYYVKVTKH